MITEQDLQAAIAECQGVRSPTASTCIKLAAFYTIQDRLYGNKEKVEAGYSFSSKPDVRQVDEISYMSDTDFSRLIYGKDQEEVWPVIDELMTVLEATNPRLYDGVMRKLNT